MPGYDKTGPMGAGPMTGGRRGLCVGGDYPYNMYGYAGYGRGRGFRRGFRGGFGAGGQRFGRRFSASVLPPRYEYPVSKEDEMEMLKADADAMNKSLEALQKRIAELKKELSE